MKNNTDDGIRQYYRHKIKELNEKLGENHDHKVPIYKECPNKGKPCFCSGVCREIIGYKEKDRNDRI